MKIPHFLPRVFTAVTLILVFASLPSIRAQLRSEDRVVRGWAVLEDDTSRCEFYWVDPRTDATGWKIYRKLATDAWWPLDVNGALVPVATLSGTARFWRGFIGNGVIYEFWIEKQVSGYTANTYLAIGRDVQKTESRGRVLLVHTPTAVPPQTFKNDLIGDGWLVELIQVNEGDLVSSVKDKIKTKYNEPAGAKAVILIGRVPVPYSGLFTHRSFNTDILYENDPNTTPPPPDYHDDHEGAWPADAYYGDMDGTWTDTSPLQLSDLNRGFEPERNQTNPNGQPDGKFDQSRLPSAIELPVGRIDFRKLHATFGYADTPQGAALGEAELLTRYFQKNRSFRMGGFRSSIPNRAAISDDWQELYEAGGYGSMESYRSLTATAWANFSGFFGVNGWPQHNLNIDYLRTRIPTIQERNYFITLSSSSGGALWSAAAGAGQFDRVAHDPGNPPSIPQRWYIGHANDFNTYSIKSVFLLFGGSYMGDWDVKDNFLRSSIGSKGGVPSYTLTAIWMGRPHLFLHHMFMGGTIGESLVKSQNNARNPNGSDVLYRPADFVTPYGTDPAYPARLGAGKVHLALLGDPTLRMHVVYPVQNLAITRLATTINLTWTHSLDSSDPGFRGYFIYRASSANGPFVRQNTTPVLGTQYSQATPPAGSVYMVRACKSEAYRIYGEFGNYDNLSTGIMVAY